jgi:hypothetical protein
MAAGGSGNIRSSSCLVCYFLLLRRSPPSAAPEAPALPKEVLVSILQQLPLPQRLTCALVCNTWAAAAAAVPTAVSTQLRSNEHCQQLQHWLSKHAGLVVSLNNPPHLYRTGDPGGSWSPLQLPVHKFVRLRSLDLSWLKLQSAQGASTGSSSSGGSSLTERQAAMAAAAAAQAAASVMLLYCRSCRSCCCPESRSLRS